MSEQDTIVALSTPVGSGGIGIVRMSGPDAIAITGRIFSRPLGKTKSHTITYGVIHDPDSAQIIDEVLLTVLRAPRTYTREDMVEINCHGGMVPVRETIELLIRLGARPASPGEFTKRAFLNGRIDLTQAEAVLDIINAKTRRAERIAMGQLRGELSVRVEQLRARAIDICSQVEAHIDFPDEDIDPGTVSAIRDSILALQADIKQMIQSYDEGRLMREGLKTAIIGRPNVGKSSLLNALLGRERAIVTEMPGTTRDVIEESASVRGLPLIIIDTAGIRSASDMAEAEGIRRSHLAAASADMVLAVIDGSLPVTDADTALISGIAGRTAIIVINKSDLPQAERDLSGFDLPAVKVSARDGSGLDALREAVYALATHGLMDMNEGVMITNIRHKTALASAHARLIAAHDAIGQAPLEICAMELRSALDALCEIVGDITADDVLNRIFSAFCIGK